MTQSDPHQSLRDLNDEIDNTHTDDEHKQTLLQDLRARVQRVLDDPDGDHHLGLPEPLREAAIELEVEHPSLSRAMQIAANSLSAMGM